ncbi:membrane-associated protein [Methanosarcina horonobensis HB-1 = JCM 15518]|uniref:Membrane-associated protein n=1 Tax=Methanosarcina horonobensis HB-1 = JCM 15518 TaxID=1434110 RepID=A0A0E3WV28_9EURY|nr:vWA domain-containing protein [Methanosarcina horonobensis]AKB79140.1 membrane-associated protein [Methanosarcina horonobensis HB-1 = JCM 15518]
MTFDFPYGFNFLHISELMLLGPLALFVFLGLWKKIDRRHLFVHSLVIFFLIIALAAPYSVEMSSPKTNQSRITIISDESASMDLLEKGVSKEVADELNTRVPVAVTTISGIHTSLGDAIIQQASPENYVLVISDGQSNSGTPVEEALSYCYKNNFPVSALIPRTVEEDLSVEIEGENEAVIDNKAFFKVNVRKSIEDRMSYQVRITIDHQKVLEREITQTGRVESIEFNHTFETLGPHTVKATLHPASISVKNLDYFENNNQYMKSVYVTPKPKVLLVTNEPDSPLANTMKEIYDVRIAGSFSSLNNMDAVIIDNQAASTISDIETRALRDYIINGGGMVVIGGGSSFDFPAEYTYKDTRFEELLPVTSEPSSWRGGRNVVLMLDVSPSTLQSNGVGGRVLDEILSNAVVLLESDLLKDARVNVITFGSKGQDITNGFVDMSKESNRLWLDAEIRKISPTGDSTSLERGLMTARTLLKEQENNSEADIIIVSDGGIGNIAEGDLRFERAIQCAENLHENSGIGIHFVHIHAPKTTSQVTPKGQYYAELFMNKIGLSQNYNRIEPGERIKVSFSKNPEESEELENEYSSGSIVVYDPKHFITRNISDIQHDILGYNEVTPKPEANRLVITRLGKPIITVWRLGLGRVAAITTDNGNGNGIPWAASLYSGNDSLIITRTLNWAVADTEMSEGIQLEVPDLKMSQPGRILITTGGTGVPELYFDKKPMEITSIGNNMYESYVTANTFGLHKISETPLEANLTEELMSEVSGVKNVSWRPAAVNRPDEYTYVGENFLFRTAILENGGKIYTKGDVYSRIIEDASISTKKKILTKVFYTKYFLVLAFLIYLLYTLHHTYNTRMK